MAGGVVGIGLGLWLAASPPELQLAEVIQVEPGATCLSRDVLLEHLATWRDADTIDARVVVRVEGDPKRSRRVRFTVRFGDSHSAERTFEKAPARCADLHAVVGLAIAIALDDTLAVQKSNREKPAPKPVPPARAGPFDLPPTPVANMPPPPPRRGPEVVLRTSGLALFNVLPGVTAGADLGLELGFGPRFDARVLAAVSHGPRRPLLGGSADMTLAFGQLDICAGSPRALPVRARICAGMAAGAISAFGRDFEQNLSTTQPWAAAVVGGELDVTLWRWLGLRLGIASVVPAVRPRFQVEVPGGPPVSHDLAPIAAVGHAGLRFRLR